MTGVAPRSMARPLPVGNIRMVAVDIDGTLLRSTRELSVRVIETVKAVSKRGVKVVLASARPPRAMSEIYGHLQLDTLQINYNGAMICDPPARRHIQHTPIEPGLAKKIIAIARKTDPAVVVYLEILDKWYTDHFDENLPTETSRNFNPDFIGPLDAFLRVPVTKVMLLAPPDRMKIVRKAVDKKFGRKVAIQVSDPHLLQVVARGVDKAEGLKVIAEHYGIESQHVMAIGDAPNDIGMLQWAGLGVAMENGWKQVLEIADAIAPPAEKDGVAEVLQRYVLDVK